MSAKRKHRALAAAVGLAVVYVLLFPLPMEKELVVEPAWVLETTAAPAGRPGGEARPFLSGGRVGYYDPAGALLLAEPLVYGASIGDASFINYSRLPTSLVVKDSAGAFVAAVPAGGYPVLDAAGRRILLVSRDAKGLAGVDRSGDVLWRLEFASLITCVDFNEAGVLVGLLDGTLSLYDHGGRAVYSLKPEGSRIPVILGCAASADALACVAGIDPQRLIVVGRSEGRFQPAANLALASDFRREVLLRFSEAGRPGGALYFERADGLGVFDLRSRAAAVVPLPGRVRALAEAPQQRLWAALHDGGDGAAGLRVYQGSDRLLARERLPADADFVAGSGSGFVVGFGSRLVSVEVRRE